MGCASLSDERIAVVRAAERFVVGYPEEADAMVVAGRTDVLEAIRALDVGPSGIEATLLELAAAREFGPLRGSIPSIDRGRLVDNRGRVAHSQTLWATMLLDEPSVSVAQDSETGRVNVVNIVPELPCEGAVLWSVFMGMNTDPADPETYAADYLRWWHPGPAVRALVEPLAGEVEHVAWTVAPEELIHWQVYACVPWQISLYSADFVMVDSPEEW